MKSCLIIINKSAGGSSKVSFEKVERCLGDEYKYTRCAIPDNPDPNPEGYDAVAVCGGDGTLGSVLSKIYDKPIDVWYFPVGTLSTIRLRRKDIWLQKPPALPAAERPRASR